MCFDYEIPERMNQKVPEKKNEKKIAQTELEKIEEGPIAA
jgi:hypothetical protein